MKGRFKIYVFGNITRRNHKNSIYLKFGYFAMALLLIHRKFTNLTLTVHKREQLLFIFLMRHQEILLIRWRNPLHSRKWSLFRIIHYLVMILTFAIIVANAGGFLSLKASPAALKASLSFTEASECSSRALSNKNKYSILDTVIV